MIGDLEHECPPTFWCGERRQVLKSWKSVNQWSSWVLQWTGTWESWYVIIFILILIMCCFSALLYNSETTKLCIIILITSVWEGGRMKSIWIPFFILSHFPLNARKKHLNDGSYQCDVRCFWNVNSSRNSFLCRISNMCWAVLSLGLVLQRCLLQLFLLVPSDLCPPRALRLTCHPQHPPLLSHQTSRETETEASGEQSQGWTSRTHERVIAFPCSGTKEREKCFSVLCKYHIIGQGSHKASLNEIMSDYQLQPSHWLLLRGFETGDWSRK